MFEFSAFPKIPRLNRGMVITEKIDGTNGCVVIGPVTTEDQFEDLKAAGGVIVGGFGVTAQSRNRTLSLDADNYSFARWVHSNAEKLIDDLGIGYHFGEWWGNGVQRGYGLKAKRFSLFNERRWSDFEFTTPGLDVVPVLHAGAFSTRAIDDVIYDLNTNGSVAAPGYDSPEGVVIYLPAARASFKVLCENDDQAKGQLQAVAA